MEIIERINQYWSKRADEFGDARYADMQNEKRERWLSLIKGNLPKKISKHWILEPEPVISLFY